MLNSKFVPSCPQGPAYSPQAHPKDAPRYTGEVGSQAAQLGKGGRGPRDTKPVPHATPNKLSQVTVKKDMIRVFPITAKGTELGAQPISLTNLISRGKPASESLPQENFNLRGNTSLPNLGKTISRRATNELRIKRLNRKTPRGRKRPKHRIPDRRERREEGSKTLPIFKLYRRQRAVKGQVPPLGCKLRNRNTRIRAVREKGREGHRER